MASFISGNRATFAGITNSFAYNKRLQPVSMSATTPSQTVFLIAYDFHLGNGDNGNVWGIANNKDITHGRDQTFTNDDLNRVISAQNAGTDCSVMVLGNKTEYWGNSYSYDAWGNLLQKTVTKCGAEHLSVTADAHNWLHASGTDYQYDAAGNMTYDATASLSYNFDQENRLTGAAGYTYTYDGDGNRVRKSNGNLAANGTLYWYMTPGVVAESDLAGTLKSEYVFFDGERVARKDFPSNAVAYYFSDHLKTASVITDSAGGIKAESDYYPWGGELQFVNNDSNDYKFTGKKRDGETGLDYFGARYYSNGLGRWVSADWSPTPVPVPYASLGDPQSLNLYGYVRGLPTTKADIDGHGWLQIVVHAIKQRVQEQRNRSAEEHKQADQMFDRFAEKHPALKAWEQFTQKVDNALNLHGWKTDKQVAAQDAKNREDWAKIHPKTPYPEIKIGIVIPVGLGALEEGTIYRAGGTNPGNLTGKDLSFRDSLSNPIDSASNPVFKPGKEWFSTDVAKLPEGAAVSDGGTAGLPEGHVTVNATIQEIKSASEGMPKGKFPKD